MRVSIRELSSNSVKKEMIRMADSSPGFISFLFKVRRQNMQLALSTVSANISRFSPDRVLRPKAKCTIVPKENEMLILSIPDSNNQLLLKHIERKRIK